MAKPQSFVKGDPRINRKGAPKREWTWAGELQKAAEQMAANGKSVKEILANSLFSEALKGNVAAHKIIMDRMDGMPAQDVTSGGEKLEPIKVTIVEDKPETE